MQEHRVRLDCFTEPEQRIYEYLANTLDKEIHRRDKNFEIVKWTNPSNQKQIKNLEEVLAGLTKTILFNGNKQKSPETQDGIYMAMYNILDMRVKTDQLIHHYYWKIGYDGELLFCDELIEIGNSSDDLNMYNGNIINVTFLYMKELEI